LRIDKFLENRISFLAISFDFAFSTRKKRLLSKNLDTDLKIILLGYENNYVGRLSIMSNAAKNFDILATNLNITTKLV